MSLLDNIIYAVVPAAGIGARMGSEIPKQYLSIDKLCIIEYALLPLLENNRIKQVVVALSANDQWFHQLAIASHPKISIVTGGNERADSVLNALRVLPQDGFVLVHDGARPCITQHDIDLLIDSVLPSQGALLGSLVRDTMKRVDAGGLVKTTVPRDLLYHALTPQIFPTASLTEVLAQALAEKITITDEASAMQWAGMPIKMVEGRSDNIKVTRPEDLELATIFLSAQQRLTQQQVSK